MDGTAPVRRELPVELVGGAVFRLFNGSSFCPGLFSAALLDAFVRDFLSKGNVSARFLPFHLKEDRPLILHRYPLLLLFLRWKDVSLSSRN